MIARDQPTIFSSNVVARVSSRDDGTMLDRSRQFHEDDVVRNREMFCESAGVSYEKTVYQLITYGDEQTYQKIAWVAASDTTKFTPEVAADALFTREKNIGLFLPVADCIGMVFFDPHAEILALAHVGRHASIARLGENVVQEYKNAGSDPANLLVWFSPAASKNSYLLNYFDHQDDSGWRGFYQQTDKGILLDLAGYNKEILLQTGIKEENIQISGVDTVTSPDYFSHSAGDANKRIAVVAMMTSQH